MRHDTSSKRPFITLALTIAIAFTCVLLPRAAQAQGGGGIRGGVSSNPDQFYFGAHFDTGYLFERLSFRPNVEVGLGNDLTTVAANFEFAYWFPLPHSSWSVYAGGGPAMNIFRYTGGNTDTQPGFNLLGGISHHNGLFAEVKFGRIHSPEVKFGVGYTWR